MIHKLRYYGDPILRKKTKEVAEVNEEIRTLARDMIETMLHYNGIGLAAPQIGFLFRIYVSNVEFEDEKGEVHIGEPRVYINPVFSNPSEAMVERSEGCLSIPKLYVPVARPLSIDVEALDIDGKPFKRECYGYLARNMMHENDHLNGVLFIDRVKGKRRTLLEPDLRRIKQQYYKSS